MTARGSSSQKLTFEEERELVARCVQLRDKGHSWRRIWETIETPYVDSHSLVYVCRKHGYVDERRTNPEALNAKREQISMAWANNPPPGSERWSDTEWLRRIDQAAFGRRAQEDADDD